MAAVRAMNGVIKSGVSRHDGSAAVLVSSPYAIAPDGFDADERCMIRDSRLSRERPRLVEWLVQLFIVGTQYVPQTAQRLIDPTDLPPALERVAMHAQRCLQTWFAWTDGPRFWFFVMEMATVSSLHGRGQALRMFFYDEKGRFISWGTWALHAGRGWVLCER